MTNQVGAKVTIAKLIEIAYSKNEGITTKILRSKGNYKLTVDMNGNATLSGSVGIFTFKGGPALESIGAKVKSVSVLFSNGDGGNIKYTATYTFLGAATLSFSGAFDIEELILSCSGLLCKAARAMKGRNQAYETELRKIMGR